jgi:ATP-dependent Clp protease protease subunit
MNYGKEFKICYKAPRVNAILRQNRSNEPANMTPYIIEERQLNISQLDVFLD